MAADSDSEDEDDSVRGSMDGTPTARPARDHNAGPIGGPLSGGLTIPATMNDPGAAALLPRGHLDSLGSRPADAPEAWLLHLWLAEQECGRASHRELCCAHLSRHVSGWASLMCMCSSQLALCACAHASTGPTSSQTV